MIGVATRTKRIAVNIADLTRYEAIPRQCLIAPVIQAREIVITEPGRVAGQSVVLNCDETRARAIVDILRSYDLKAKRYALRAYSEGPRGGWRPA